MQFASYCMAQYRLFLSIPINVITGWEEPPMEYACPAANFMEDPTEQFGTYRNCYWRGLKCWTLPGKTVRSILIKAGYLSARSTQAPIPDPVVGEHL